MPGVILTEKKMPLGIEVIPSALVSHPITTSDGIESQLGSSLGSIC